MESANFGEDRTKLSLSVLEHLVDEYYANLYRFALSLARNEAEAADLTQQTYFQLATRGGQIRDLKKAKSWLFTTLYRQFLQLRRQKRRVTSIEEAGAPEQDVPETIEAGAVRAVDASLVMEALGSVREVFRQPLALFYIESLSYREIAGILGVPIGTVMSRLSCGRSELRDLLVDSKARDRQFELGQPLRWSEQ